MNDNRNIAFDIYRGIAIIFIIILHAGVTTPGLNQFEFLFNYLTRMNIAMELFFVISGYLIYKSIYILKDNPNKTKIFFLKRSAKILPLYYLFFLINYLVYLLFVNQFDGFEAFSLNTINPWDLNWNNFFIHLFLLQGFTPPYLSSFIDGSWSIVSEVYFYILMFFIFYKFLNNTLNSYRGYLIMLSISIYGYIFLNFMMPAEGAFVSYFILNNLPSFFVGIIVYHIIHNEILFTKIKKYSLEIFTTGLLLYFGFIKGNMYPLAYNHLYGIVWGILIIGSYHYINNMKQNILIRVISRFGQQAYSLYFLHILLTHVNSYLLINVFNMGGGTKMQSASFFLIHLGSMLVISWILSNYLFNKIDNYCVKSINKIIKRKYNNEK
jgi:peptidoglycan/LPS O-acetylase OafA/YrhL